MVRPLVLRVSLVAIFLAGALALFGVGVEAQAQPPGWRIERSWKCRKCGGHLGNGVKPPTTCHHCETKRAAAAQQASNSKDSLPLATFAVVGLGVMTAVGVALCFMSSRAQSGAGG